MNILISQRYAINSHGQWADSLESDYIAVFKRFGLTLFPIPNDVSGLDRMIQAIRPSGIILSGGEDVSAEFASGHRSGRPAAALQRDFTEAALLNTAIQNRLRVFGICRGMQLINLYFKGNLESVIGSGAAASGHQCPGEHPITLVHDELSARMKKHPRPIVNSYHHQTVTEKGLAAGLRHFALEETSGVVEGLYHPGYPLAAVQWHPERGPATRTLDGILIAAFRDGEIFWR